jgi:hypothetical protein
MSVMQGEDSARAARAASGSAWIWLPLLGIGLAAVLAGPPAAVSELARESVPRLLGGDLGLGAPALLAAAFHAGWILLEPLLVVGAILLLELCFVPGAGERSYRLGWLINGASALFILAFSALARGLGLQPEPLLRIDPGDGLPSLLLIGVPALLASLFVLDFFEYWVHRAQHRFAFLWRFHAVHHSVEVDVLHNYRHPLDHLPLILFVAMPQALLIGVTQGQLYLLVAFTSLQTHLNHMRLPVHLGPLGRVFCDNRYHFVHHSPDPALFNRNFAGRFPIFDRMFGTQAARPGHLVATGLPDAGPPASFGDYLLARMPARPQGPEVQR